MAKEYQNTVKFGKGATKGHFGYIRAQKKRYLLRTLILAAGVAGMVIIGLVLTKTTKNLLSVVGILTAIPMAMQAASLIAFWKFKGRPEDEYREIQSIVGDGVLDCEFVIAKRDGKTIPVNYACFTEDEVICFTEDPTLDLKVYTEYLHTFLRLSQVDCTIVLYREIEPYKKALKSRSFTPRDEVSETVLQREGVFRAISM